MNTLHILPATEDDAPILLSFIKGLAEHVNLLHEVVATEEDLRQALFGPNRPAEAFIAYLDEVPVGYMVVCQTMSTFLGKLRLFLEDLYVKPECRGNGVGRALLRHIAKIARERGCGKLEWHVAEWNPHAKKFYEDLGAHSLQGRHVYCLAGEALDSLAGEEVVRRSQ